MPQLGIFHLVTRGAERFRILSTQDFVERPDPAAKSPCSIPSRPPSWPSVMASAWRCCGNWSNASAKSIFPPPHDYTDASWVSYRLAEILPIDRFEKQRMLVANDAVARLDRVLHLLKRG